MLILDQLRDILITRSKEIPSEKFIIHGQWAIELLFQPNPEERIFNYQIVVAQTQRQGTCYCTSTEKAEIDKSLIGKDARWVTLENKSLEIALLDAAYSAVETQSTKDYLLDGTSIEKATNRAEIIASEVLLQMPENTKQSRRSVVNVGVVGTIVSRLFNCGCQVYATDMDPILVGKYCGGVLVQDGRMHTLELVEKCDVALITGMTLSTCTLEEILLVASKSKTKVVMFAETGAWFATEYCNTFRIDSVISEPFPFYIFEGRSLIRLYRRKK